eukprot:1329529-Prymnesium_polylepis.1
MGAAFSCCNDSATSSEALLLQVVPEPQAPPPAVAANDPPPHSTEAATSAPAAPAPDLARYTEPAEPMEPRPPPSAVKNLPPPSTEAAISAPAQAVTVEEVASFCPDFDLSPVPPPPPPLDLTRYTKPMAIWAALRTGHVRLVRASWLVALGNAGGVLARRQDLPEEAFVSVDEGILQFGSGNKDGVLPVVVISFCWDRPGHPDPEGKQLKRRSRRRSSARWPSMRPPRTPSRASRRW